MAVYTDVTAEDLGRFLSGYDVGELLAYKGIAEGVENSNFLVHTATGNFILTLYEKRVAERDLPLPLDLPAEDDVRFADELQDDDFSRPPEERSPPLMFEASAVCTTLAAPSTAPIAALVNSVPAASAALDSRPLDLRLVLLDF